MNRRVAGGHESIHLETGHLEDAINGIPEFHRLGRFPRVGVGMEREEPHQAGAALIGVVVELVDEACVPRHHQVVDRGQCARLGPVGRHGRGLVGRQGPGLIGRHACGLLRAKRFVVGLRSTTQDRGKGVSDGPDVPAPDARAVRQVNGHDLARPGQARIFQPIHVQVALLDDVELSGRGVGQILGRDEVLVGRQAHVADVDATEQPVPVAVVGLAPVEMVQGGAAHGPESHRIDLVRGPQHLLVQVVDLAVLDLEVAPERSTQPARLRSALRLRGVDHGREDPALIGGQGPFAHLRVRAGRDVDPPDRPMVLEPCRWGRGREPVGVGLEGLEEAIDPASLTPAVLPGRWPRAELLAVIAHHPDPLAVLGRVIAQVADDVLDIAERDPVAEALFRAEDRHELSLVLGRIRPPQVLLADRGRAEVRVVEDRPVVTAGDERGRQVRLPDPLGQPGALGSAAEEGLELVAHPGQLADPVALGQGGEDRLVVASAQDLDLLARDERTQPHDEVGALGAQPFEQRTRVVQGQPDVRVALQRFHHRPIRLVENLGEDPAEVADGLMVVDREGERDPRSHPLS